VLLPTLPGASADAVTAASSLLQNRHQIPGEMWCTLPLFFRQFGERDSKS
jgi:hypothetical protein